MSFRQVFSGIGTGSRVVGGILDGVDRGFGGRMDPQARGTLQDVRRGFATAGQGIRVLDRVVSDPDQRRRLGELIRTNDLPGLIRALSGNNDFPPDYFPKWIRKAGGYFPKFAQVLSVRADLIKDPKVLEELGKTLEGMPTRPLAKVHQHMAQEGWDATLQAGVGKALAAGTIGQVNEFQLGGTPGVIKMAWADTKKAMETDFKLFAHARDILGSLRLEDDETATTVGAMFKAVGKNESVVLREFNLATEAWAINTGNALAAGEDWNAAYTAWMNEAETILSSAVPAQLAGPVPLPLVIMGLKQRRPTIRVPKVLRCTEKTLAMTMAGGTSLHKLLTEEVAGADEPGSMAAMVPGLTAGNQKKAEVAGVFLGGAIPFIGWLLLCKSTTHLAHVDPHPGNFRWDSATGEMWVLDWGSHIVLSDQHRRALCNVVKLIAEGASDTAIAAAARSFGLKSTHDHELANMTRDIFNASPERAAEDAIKAAAVDKLLEGIEDNATPVLRALATLGGILQKMQEQVKTEFKQNVPLNLAKLWAPFAKAGLSQATSRAPAMALPAQAISRLPVQASTTVAGGSPTRVVTLAGSPTIVAQQGSVVGGVPLPAGSPRQLGMPLVPNMLPAQMLASGVRTVGSPTVMTVTSPTQFVAAPALVGGSPTVYQTGSPTVMTVTSPTQFVAAPAPVAGGYAVTAQPGPRRPFGFGRRRDSDGSAPRGFAAPPLRFGRRR